MENKISGSLDYTLKDNNYETILNTIISGSKMDYVSSDVRDSIFEEENKRKSMQDLKLDTIDCLKITDFDAEDIFQLEEKFEQALKKWITNDSLNQILSQLKTCSLNDFFQKNKLEIPNISALRSLEHMVELTYGYNKEFMHEITEEICYLRLVSYRWRQIGGDGNCYYRSVMYSFLENIIFERDITMLQRIIVDISEKFEHDYVNTKILPDAIRNSITQIDLRIIITLLKIIFDILDISTGENHNRTNEALEILVKSFNVCKSFDIAMILYLRYKLYEFILENKDKYFSEEFPIKIGNLLPFQYETEDGQFLYDNFFAEELLKLYIYAEKIAIYLTPFVLKINLRVIFYEHGKNSNIQTKDFLCSLKNKNCLMVLYRKNHYDIIYSKEYFDKYANYINHFSSFNEQLFVVSEENMDYYKNNDFVEIDLGQSKIFDKRTQKKNEQYALTNLNNTNKTSEVQDKVNNEKEYIESNNFENKTTEIIKCLICVQCKLEKDLNGNQLLNLPCGCYFCSKECAEIYSKEVFQFQSLEFKRNPLYCYCKAQYTLFQLMKISTIFVEKYNNSTLNRQILYLYENTCMICLKRKTIETKKYEVKKYKSEIFNNYLNLKHLMHYVCGECSKNKSNYCNICESHHMLVLN